MPRCIPQSVRDQQKADSDARRAAVIEDYLWIVGTDLPENVARRLGYTSAKTLKRVFAKWGRHDLIPLMRDDKPKVGLER